MDKKTPIFIKGINAKKADKAPDFVWANVGINMADLLHSSNMYSKKGWLNLVLKESKGGALYFELDQYERVNPSMGEVAQPLVDIKKDTKTSVGYNGEPPIDMAEQPF